jgi:hypothetical protein
LASFAPLREKFPTTYGSDFRNWRRGRITAWTSHFEVFGANDRLTNVIRQRVGAIVAVFLLYVLPAAACSCATAAYRDCQAPTAEMVVLATVVSKDLVPDAPVSDAAAPNVRHTAQRPYPSEVLHRSPPVVKVTLSVAETFHGNFGNSVVVQTDTSDCGYPFETGHQYLVFANHFQGNLSVNLCGATRPATVAAPTIQQLRAQQGGAPLPQGLFGFARTHAADRSPAG